MQQMAVANTEDKSLSSQLQKLCAVRGRSSRCGASADFGTLSLRTRQLVLKQMELAESKQLLLVALFVFKKKEKLFILPSLSSVFPVFLTHF